MARGFAIGVMGMLATAVALVTGVAGCGSSSPTDMWISRDPDAGAGFEAPVREAAIDSLAPDGGAGGDDSAVDSGLGDDAPSADDANP